MIFVTVGAQMAFDRLVVAVDEWAASRGRADVFAQVGPSSYAPKAIRVTRFMEPVEFRRRVETAKVVVAHAGMGTIITALECGKPIIVMPRRGDLRETRNDHQVATVKKLAASGRVVVALDETELLKELDRCDSLEEAPKIEAYASPQLVAAIRGFIEVDERRSKAAPGGRTLSRLRLDRP